MPPAISSMSAIPPCPSKPAPARSSSKCRPTRSPASTPIPRARLSPAMMTAVFSTLDQSGQPLKAGGTPFTSMPVQYSIVPAPQLGAQAGCSDGAGNFTAAPPDSAAPNLWLLNDAQCWPAVQVISFFGAPQEAQLSIDRQQLFGFTLVADDLTAPQTITATNIPAEALHNIPLSDTDTRSLAPPLTSPLDAADRLVLRILLRNPDTGQLAISDPFTVGFDRVHIVSCNPDPATGILSISNASVMCNVQYSAWDNGLNLDRTASATGGFGMSPPPASSAPAVRGSAAGGVVVTILPELPAGGSGTFPDNFTFPPATTGLSSPLVLYGLVGAAGTVAYDLATFWRVAQSLGDLTTLAGNGNVAQFAQGQLRLLNDAGLQGKYGN